MAAFCALAALLPQAQQAWSLSDADKGNIYQAGPLKPVDSRLKVKVGERAPLPPPK